LLELFLPFSLSLNLDVVTGAVATILHVM
jgi:hypothetical protein